MTNDEIEILIHWKKDVNSIINMGLLLQKYSERSDWLSIQDALSESNIMSATTISMLRTISKCELIVDPLNRDKLPVAYNTLYHLATLDISMLKKLFDMGKISPSLLLVDVREWKKMTR